MGEKLTAHARHLIADGLAGCQPIPPVPASAILSEVVGHLKSALLHHVASPADPTLIGHVRTAHEMAVLVLRQATRNAL